MKVSGDSDVPNRINGVQGKTSPIAPAAAVTLRPGNPREQDGQAGESNTDVQLTGTARSLAALEQSVRSLPAVDELRVAAVRQRLQEGSYEVDPQRVADRLLRLESDLRQAAPLDSNPLK